VAQQFLAFSQASVHDLLVREHRQPTSSLTRQATPDEWVSIALSYIWFNQGLQAGMDAAWEILSSQPPFVSGDGPAEQLLRRHRLWVDEMRHRPTTYQGEGVFLQPPTPRRSGMAMAPSACESLPPLEVSVNAPATLVLGAAPPEPVSRRVRHFYSSTLEEQEQRDIAHH
jgi:hypothetical protein